MKYSFLLAVLTFVPAVLGNVIYKADFPSGNRAPEMQTNIALVGSKEKLGELGERLSLAIVDPTRALEDASSTSSDGDIQEDPRDPFMTGKDGKLRPNLIEDSDEWADEELVVDSRSQSRGDRKVLSRKKRCSRRDDDDDGDARRSRRTRRVRGNRGNNRNRTTKKVRKIKRNKKSKRARAIATSEAARTNTSTTTVVRKVIQNGQVVSSTSETHGAAPVVTQPGQVVVQSQPATPIVQTVQPVQTIQPVAAAQPSNTVSVPGVPSVAISGSIKVN